MDERALTREVIHAFGPFRLDAAERRLTRDGAVVALEPKAFHLLVVLVTASGRLKSREELTAALWPNTIVEEQGLSLRVHALRRALGDNGRTPRYIETVRGAGYRFIAAVTVEPRVAAGPAIRPEATPASRPEVAPARTPPQTRRAGILIAGVALCVAAALIAWYFIAHPPGVAPNPPARPSIAVLPFDNLSAEPANAYFAAGVQDEILTRLAAIRSLKVIARTSTANYASHPPDLTAIGRQLGVATVLEGSVQKAGNEVHINVQLIDTRTLAHIWAKSYNRRLTDVFKVEGDVAQAIATALSARLLPHERARLTRAPTHDAEAYIDYLRANHYADRVFNLTNVSDRAAGVRQATALYRKAIARDPGFTLAWTRLSLLQSRAWWFDITSDESETALATKAAKRAVALDPALPEAHLAMGYVEYFVHTDYAAALAQFEHAHQQLPSNVAVAAAIAYIHRRQGKWQQALAELESVASLDPRNPRRHYEIAVTLATLHQYAAAEQQLDEALAVEPQDYLALAYKVRLLFLAGDTQRANAVLATVPAAIDPQGAFSSLRFEAAWLAREPRQALTALASAPMWVQSTHTLSPVPANLLRGEALALEGNAAAAQRAYLDARDKLQGFLAKHPRNAPGLYALGITYAGLGDTRQAIQAGLRATRVLPLAKDAYYGVVPLTVLARIYARTGETAKAVALLDQLLTIPAGEMISASLLRLDPAWDPLRKDPRFQALLQTRKPDVHTLAPSALRSGAGRPR